MRVYIDEHVDDAIAEGLRRAGCDVVRAVDRHPGEPNDEVHLVTATQERRLLMTRDEDFLRLHAEYLSSGREHAGIAFWPQIKHYGIGYVIRRVLNHLQTVPEPLRRNRVLFV